MAEGLGVRAQQAALAVRQVPLLAELPDQGLGMPQVGAGHGGEQVVFDLVVQAAQCEVSQPAAADVAGSKDLAAQKVGPVGCRQDRHALVVGGERRAQVQAEQALLHQDEHRGFNG